MGLGRVTIDGKTVEYISFLKGAWPSKEVWYWSTDGLNYTQVSSKIADQTVSGAAARNVTTTARPDNDWNQANTNTGMTTLGVRGLLAAPDFPSSNTGGSDGDAGGSLPACAEADNPVDPPEGLPPELPLPPGLVLTDAQSPAEGDFNLRGVVAGELQETADFFREELPKNGFEPGEGDAEEQEQEAEFDGNGYEGEWRVVRSPDPDCRVVAVFVTLIGD